MAGNSFGTLFRFTTWGESHGPAIGVVVDGVPPRLPLAEPYIQQWLDKRKPGQSRYTTQRREADLVRIMSGTFDGVTTGTPIQLLIENTDYRGGGRASARETASRVAAGAIARKVLGPGVTIRGALVQIGPHAVDRDSWDWRATEENPFWCPDAAAALRWADYLDSVRKAGTSAGAIIEIVASGVPAGLGEPVYDKLDGDLARALMTINAVKGVEIGAGFAAAALRGEDNADEMRIEDGQVVFLSNNAGGILGGISTGQDVVARFVVKPTSSILHPMRTVDVEGNEVEISTHGRHDPCVGIRAVPVGEAMVACVLADHLLRHRAIGGSV